jgi:hypothetical protein
MPQPHDVPGFVTPQLSATSSTCGPWAKMAQDACGGPKLATLVGTAAREFASFLLGEPAKRDAQNHGLSLKKLKSLKRLLALIWVNLLTLHDILSESAELEACLERIAEVLADLLDTDYLSSFGDENTKVIHTNTYASLRCFGDILNKHPSKFEVEKVVRRDRMHRLSDLLEFAKEWQQVLDDLELEIDDAEPDDEKDKRIHPKVQLDQRVFHGSTSVRMLAEHLYETLHSHWPCKLEKHDADSHEGTLGVCDEAKMHLDPHWTLQGVQGEKFLVILKGSGITQECMVNMAPSNHRYVPIALAL